ncbi:unnamed protein product [Cylicocyclus nassatus]|uniref:Uncharacterized protein n=1 Tax=Cylicocyclus nassatus TaxID=53992 RepID=A0AA36MFK8_CYLNA|nr:unnamed protein product [Cylicocyclus nassatus]
MASEQTIATQSIMDASEHGSNTATSSNNSPSTGDHTRKFGPQTTALESIADVDLSGKTMLITGTTAGIGMETARALALKGAHVVMANRNILKAEELKNGIIAEKPGAKIDMIMCDLTSLQSVQAAANEFKSKQWPLHALILNAGVFFPEQKMTIDGLETTFCVNHVSHQYLVRELLPLLRQSQGRIVILSSSSHNHTGLKPDMPLEEKLTTLCPTESAQFGYRYYAYSKLCNVLMGMKLHRDENKNGISVYIVHPGRVNTDAARSFGVFMKIVKFVTHPFTKSLEQGAATTVYCAASPDVSDVSGKYWEECWHDEKNLSTQLAHDMELQDALWKKTNEILDKYEATRRQ